MPWSEKRRLAPQKEYSRCRLILPSLFLPEASAIRRSVWSSVKSKAGGFPPSAFASAGKSALRSNLREPIICDIPMVMRWASRSAKLSRSESCWKVLNFLNRLRNQGPLSTVLFVGKSTGSRKWPTESASVKVSRKRSRTVKFVLLWAIFLKITAAVPLSRAQPVFHGPLFLQQSIPHVLQVFHPEAGNRSSHSESSKD